MRLTIRWNRRYATPGRDAPRLTMRIAAQRRTARLNSNVRLSSNTRHGICLTLRFAATERQSGANLSAGA